jgi:hypothetical protein
MRQENRAQIEEEFTVLSLFFNNKRRDTKVIRQLLFIQKKGLIRSTFWRIGS